MSSGNPPGLVSYIIGSGKCVWNSCQKHQKAAGWGFGLHVLDYWKSLAHKYDTLWRQNLTPQLFGSSDINFKHRSMIIWWKYIALGGCPKRFKHFGQKLPSYCHMEWHSKGLFRPLCIDCIVKEKFCVIPFQVWFRINLAQKSWGYIIIFPFDSGV